VSAWDGTPVSMVARGPSLILAYDAHHIAANEKLRVRSIMDFRMASDRTSSLPTSARP
jgi:hypothetical protein